jgi:hypothetical protein
MVIPGDDLHQAYDTEQVFTADYPHGGHSVLPAWNFRKPLTWWECAKEGGRFGQACSQAQASRSRARLDIRAG